MKVTDSMVETFCNEYHDHDGAVDYDAVRLALEAVFIGCQDSHVPPERPLKEPEAQCNDGWIKHTGNKRPYGNISEVKCKDGSTWSTGLSVYISWEQDLENPVIAYRIIPEAKEDIKSDIRKQIEGLKPDCICEHPKPSFSRAHCEICWGKYTQKLQEKEPKKHTLLESFYEGMICADTREYKLISKISEYLEQQNK